MQINPKNFNAKLDPFTVEVHNSCYPIDTHLDSISGSYYFGFDLENRDWSIRKNYVLAAIAKLLLPAGENKPHYGHVAFSDLEIGGYGGACFTAHAVLQNIFPKLWADRALKKIQEHYDLFLEYTELNNFNITVAKNSAEIEQSRSIGKKVALFCIEGAHCLGIPTVSNQKNRLNLLRKAKQDQNAVYLTLNHYSSTDISPASYKIGPDWMRHLYKNFNNDTTGPASSYSNGLTEFGREFVSLANEVGLLIDVTHTNTEAIIDICEISKANNRPVFASHASLRTPIGRSQSAPSKHTMRGIESEAIHAIAETGGCISVVMCPYFLQDRRDKNGKQIKDGGLGLVVDTMEFITGYLSKQGLNGSKHISFGSDFDGGIACLPREMNSGADLPILTQMLLDRKWSIEHIQDLYSENFLRTLKCSEA
ncbi:MAG: membrane dipeptidase [Hyphomicrobiales bacterium]